jgi:predicted regulator of Ras-like GTPase activity (Roadblock/LC7/MglB family)
MDEIYTFALKNVLTEMENACPEMKNAFIFRGDGEIVTGDEHTPENTIVQAIDALDGLLEKADAIGGVTSITLDQSKGQLKVTSIEQIYLVTATSQEANLQYVNTVTRVLIPTVFRLIENVNPTSLKWG